MSAPPSRRLPHSPDACLAADRPTRDTPAMPRWPRDSVTRIGYSRHCRRVEKCVAAVALRDGGSAALRTLAEGPGEDEEVTEPHLAVTVQVVARIVPVLAAAVSEFRHELHEVA